MIRYKMIRGFMTTVVALFCLSATAGKVEVIGDGSQGTVDWKAEGAVITLTVTPTEGNFIRKNDITITKTFMPTAARRRAEVPIGDGLTLVGADPDDLSLPRTYTVTMPGEEYDLLVRLQFSNCQIITESMVRLSETVFVYNENAQRPKVFVSGLTEGTDFTVTYDNPASASAGEYGITIKGRSTWTGTVRRTYKIFTGGKAEVNKSIEGGTIATAVDGLTVMLTVTPTDGYYIRKQDIAVAKTYMPVAASRRSIPVADRLELTGDDPDDLSLPRTYTAQLSGWEYSAYVDAMFTKRQTLTESMVTLSATSFVYNTSDQKPTISVTGLTEGKDFLVAYNGTSWADVDTYMVTITGRSTWKGTISRTWQITKAPSEVTTVPMAQSLIYSKTAQQLVNTGDAIGGTLVYGLDNTALQPVIPTGVDAGNYTVYYRVLGDANHFDSEIESVLVTIAKKAINISGITAQDKVYDGTTAATLGFDQVVYGGIVSGDNLTITAKGAFADANAGTDKNVIITELTLGGTSIANYQLAESGQQTTATATITPRSIEGAILSDIAAQPYTGEPLTPAVSVTLDGTLLTAGTDYRVTYANNVNVGEAIVTVTGIGNYQGSVQKTFTITVLVAVVITDPQPQTLVYSGKAQQLVTAGEAEGGTMVYSLDGTDYQTAIPTGVDAKIYTVYYKVQGDSNHSDTEAKSVTATITPRSIEGAVLSVSAQPYTGEPLTPAVSVTLDGTLLTAGTDYRVTYANNVNVGEAIVTVTGIGNYQGSVQTSFAITITSVVAVVITDPQPQTLVYSGEAQQLVTAGEADGGTMLYSLDGTDYQEAIPTGVDAKTYTVYYMVQGDSNHTDSESASVNVTIAPKEVLQPTILLSTTDYTYDGTAKEPDVTVMDGEAVIAASEYTVGYANNINAGKATVTITDKEGGNYVVNGSTSFTISKVPSVITQEPQPLALDHTGEAQTLVVAGETEGGTMVYSLDGETFTAELPSGTDAGIYTVSYKVQGDNNHSDTEVFTLKSSITPALADESGKEVDADFIEGEDGGIEVIMNTLPDNFWENTDAIPSTVSDENGNKYEVTLVSAEAFDNMPSDIIVVLPEGMSTTDPVPNVINGDGTCETLDLTNVSGLSLPIDVEAEKVVYDREVTGESTTICLPYDLPVPENTTAYVLDNTDSYGITLEKYEGVLEANQPYVLMMKETASARRRGGDDTSSVINLGTSNVTISHSAEEGSVVKNNFTLCGTLHSMTHEEGLEKKAYIMLPDNSWRMTASSDPAIAKEQYLAPFQAYLLYTGVGELEEISTSIDSSTTGVQTARPNITQSPRDGWYDMNGRKLNGKPTRKGAYLHQGKVIIL